MAGNEITFILGVDNARGIEGIRTFGRELENTGTIAQNTSKDSAQAADSFGASLGSVKTIAASLGITFGALQIASQLRDMASEAIKFDASMRNVETLLIGTGVSSRTLSNEILGLNGNLGSSTQLADALYESLSAGVEPAKSVEFVATATKLAKAELFDAGNAAKLLATIMNAYGREITDVNHVSDVFVKTINVGIVRGEELAGALGKVISTASMAHVSIEEVSAAVAIMTRAGISADEATTALNQALLTFISPSKQAKELAAALGLELNATTLQTHGFQGALELVKEATGGDITLINELFQNVRAGKAVMALTGAQAQDFTKLIDEMKTTVGDTTKAFDVQQQSISGQWSAAWNEAQRIVDRFITTMGTGSAGAMNGFNDLLRENRSTLQGLADAAAAWFLSLGHDISVAGQFVADFTNKIKVVAQTVAGYKGDLGELKKQTDANADSAARTAREIEEWFHKEEQLAKAFQQNHLKDHAKDMGDVVEKAKAAAAETKKFHEEVNKFKDTVRPASLDVKAMNQAIIELTKEGALGADIIEKMGKKALTASVEMKAMGLEVPAAINAIATAAANVKIDEIVTKNRAAMQKVEAQAEEDWRKHLDQESKDLEKDLEGRITAYENYEKRNAKADEEAIKATDKLYKDEIDLIMKEKEKADNAARDHARKASEEIKQSAGAIFDAMFTKGQSVFSSLTNALKGGALSLGRSIFVDVTGQLLGPVKKAFDDFFKGLMDTTVGKFARDLGKTIGDALDAALGNKNGGIVGPPNPNAPGSLNMGNLFKGGLVAAGISAAIFGISKIINSFGQGRKTADQFVKELQNPFGSALIDIHDKFYKAYGEGKLSADDAQTAADHVTQLWSDFTTAANNFAKQGSNQAKVVKQAFDTLAFVPGVINQMHDVATKLKDAEKDAAVGQDDFRDAMDGATDSTKDATDALNDLDDAACDAAKCSDKSATAQDDLGDSLNDTTRDVDHATDTVADLGDSVTVFADNAKDAATAVDTFTQQIRALFGATTTSQPIPGTATGTSLSGPRMPSGTAGVNFPTTATVATTGATGSSTVTLSSLGPAGVAEATRIIGRMAELRAMGINSDVPATVAYMATHGFSAEYASLLSEASMMGLPLDPETGFYALPKYHSGGISPRDEIAAVKKGEMHIPEEIWKDGLGGNLIVNLNIKGHVVGDRQFAQMIGEEISRQVRHGGLQLNAKRLS